MIHIHSQWVDVAGMSVNSPGQAVEQGPQIIPEELQRHGRNWNCPRLVSGLGGGVQMPLRKPRTGAELGLRAVQRMNTVESLGAGMLHSDRKDQQGPGPTALELMVA